MTTSEKKMLNLKKSRHKRDWKSGIYEKTKCKKNRKRRKRRNPRVRYKNISNKIREKKFPNLKKSVPIKVT